MNKSELIEKIKKLLALSDSSNPNEAAIALSRAQKLMEKYKIEQQGGKDRGGMNYEIGIDIYTLWILCIKYITNEKLFHRTGNTTQCSVVT